MNKIDDCHCEERIARRSNLGWIALLALAMTGLLATGCTPTVQVQAPDKPIEINLNVNIEHRVKVEIEKDVKQAIAQNKDIF